MGERGPTKVDAATRARAKAIGGSRLGWLGILKTGIAEGARES